jgi:hypothetical protein
MKDSGRKLTTPKVADRYGVTTRSVERWGLDPKLQFPRPLLINRRKYWDENELQIWERKRATSAATAATAA